MEDAEGVPRVLGTKSWRTSIAVAVIEGKLNLTSYYYENPHISLSGTLGFLQSASSVEGQAASDIIYNPGSTTFIDLGDEDNPLDLEPKGPTAEAVHQAYETFLTHFENSPSVEGSLAICWQPLSFLIRQADKSDEEAEAALEKQNSYLRQLEKIVGQVKPKVEPDGYVLDKDAAIFIHLSVGLILLDEHLNGGQSEQQWEWLDDALRVCRLTETKSVLPFHEQTKFPRTLSLSYKIAKALMLSKSASRSFRQHRYEEALKAYLESLLRICLANNDIFYWLVDEDELPGDKRHTEFVLEDAFEDDLLENEEGKPLRGIHPWHFPGGVFDFENAVRAFDAVIDEDSRDTDWTQLANYCRLFGMNWHLLSIQVNSKYIPEQETVGESWAIAHGIVLNKMSNDDRIAELRRGRDYQIEDRLRLYFFGETWDKMSKKARSELISADREYEHTRGWRPGIFEHLCLATRELLVEVLLKPYNDFRSAQKQLTTLAALRPAAGEYEDLYNTIQQLYYAPLFEKFLEQEFNSEERKFIKDLESEIRRLNSLRNDAVHDHRKTLHSFETDIRETYAKFLGIGHPGILPRLMCLHPKARAKPSDTRQ